MKTWHKVALAVAVPGGLLIAAVLTVRYWLVQWEQGGK